MRSSILLGANGAPLVNHDPLVSVKPGQGIWRDLVLDGAIPRIGAAIERAVLQSYRERPSRARSGATDRERVVLCRQLVEVMRGDWKMAVAHIVDALPAQLVRRLDGLDPERPTRSLWLSGEDGDTAGMV